jgi:hypothetical protein
VALGEGDQATAGAHLEAGVSVLGGLGPSHQAAWAMATLAALSADEEDPVEAGRWLERARGQFERVGIEPGIAYCHSLEVGKAVQSAD